MSALPLPLRYICCKLICWELCAFRTKGEGRREERKKYTQNFVRCIFPLTLTTSCRFWRSRHQFGICNVKVIFKMKAKQQQILNQTHTQWIIHIQEISCSISKEKQMPKKNEKQIEKKKEFIFCFRKKFDKKKNKEIHFLILHLWLQYNNFIWLIRHL